MGLKNMHLMFRKQQHNVSLPGRLLRPAQGLAEFVVLSLLSLACELKVELCSNLLTCFLRSK